MVTFEYVASTALAAFFASLAAVLVTWRLNSAAHRRDAKSQVLAAIAAHINNLWDYSLAYSQSRISGAANGATNKGQFAPIKPPVSALIVSIHATRPYFSPKAQKAILELTDLVGKAEVSGEIKSELADWETETNALRLLALRVAPWNGRSPHLP